MTQEYGIECPGTKSVFNFKTGEIMEWYPTNPVLRFLTPQGTCRALETYPVRLEQVRAAAGARRACTKRHNAGSMPALREGVPCIAQRRLLAARP